MTGDQLSYEYFILSFVPSVFSSESTPIGILLREMETGSTEPRLRFVGAKFVEEVQASPVGDFEADETLIREATVEIRAMVERAHGNGQHDDLDALLKQLLNANSGVCAFGPHLCPAVGNPESELQTLFERLVNQLS